MTVFRDVVTVLQRLPRRTVVTLAFLSTWVTLALAHEWYPPSCCSDRDCAPYPATNVRETPNGFLLHDGVLVPYAKTQASPDGQFHRCSRPDGSVICFFAVIGGY
jgi:hypothetical protein